MSVSQLGIRVPLNLNYTLDNLKKYTKKLAMTENLEFYLFKYY